MTRRQWMIYGATGYTGRHTAEWAVAHGMQPVLAGRNEEKVRTLAVRLGLEWTAFELVDTKSAAVILEKYSTVLHCAGPFIHTYKSMIEACIAAGTHYLDINGEVDVCEGLAAYEAAAQKAGIMIMPTVGFDMVPGDCLALQLKERMPDAIEFNVGYRTEGTITRGSIRSALATFTPDSQVRRDHRIARLTTPMSRTFDFGPSTSGGVHECHANTFGDISIAWRTTQIPNVTVYLYINPAFAKLAALSSEAEIAKLPEGPSDEELRTQSAFIVGEVRNAAGDTCRARLRTPQVYGITFPLAATIAQRVHEGACVPGFQTPARMFGKDFILGFDGCTIEWLT